MERATSPERSATLDLSLCSWEELQTLLDDGGAPPTILSVGVTKGTVPGVARRRRRPATERHGLRL